MEHARKVGYLRDDQYDVNLTIYRTTREEVGKRGKIYPKGTLFYVLDIYGRLVRFYYNEWSAHEQGNWLEAEDYLKPIREAAIGAISRKFNERTKSTHPQGYDSKHFNKHILTYSGHLRGGIKSRLKNRRFKSGNRSFKGCR